MDEGRAAVVQVGLPEIVDLAPKRKLRPRQLTMETDTTLSALLVSSDWATTRMTQRVGRFRSAALFSIPEYDILAHNQSE